MLIILISLLCCRDDNDNDGDGNADDDGDGNAVVDVEVEEVTKSNVHQSIKEIRNNSAILSDLEKEGKIKIVGAVYHVEDGQVSYL